MNNVYCIIPCYNAQNTINRCFDSINKAFFSLNPKIQKAQLLVICINDGSTDNTESILLDIKNKNSNLSIEIINQHNQGAGFARNTGLDFIFSSLSKPRNDDYLMFVDADDEIDTRFFTALLPYINSQTIVCGQSTSSTKQNYSTITYSSDEALESLITYKKHEIKSGCVNKIYPLQFWKSVRFPSITYCEDLVTNIAAFEFAKSIVVIHYNTYIVHRDGSTLTSKSFDYDKAEKWLKSLLYLSQLEYNGEIKNNLKLLICDYYLELVPKASYSTAKKYKRLIKRKDLIKLKGGIKTTIKKYAYLLLGWKLYYYLRNI